MNNFLQNIFIDLNQYLENVFSPNEYLPSSPTFIDLNQYLEDVYSPINTYVSMPPPEDIPLPNKKKNLTFDQKIAVIQMLFQESRHGILPK